MTRLDLFKNLPRSVDVAEVGTLQGDFAKEIIQARPDLFLFCVDYWPGKFASYEEKWHTTMDAHVQSNPDGLKHVFITRMPSVEAASKFGCTFQLVYIDAAHDYESVTQDLRAWWSCVAPGGIFAGHDFETKPDDGFWGPIEVQAAVLDWAHKLGLKVNKTDEHDCPSWWVVKP